MLVVPDTILSNHTGLNEMRIGVCLSGGGFRASLYGLGVMRYLAEAGLLRRVRAISAVSGGSIAAAALADKWPAVARGNYSFDAYVDEVSTPFHQAVTMRDIRNEAIRHFPTRKLTAHGRAQGSAIGAAISRRILMADRVVDLDPGMQVILNCTDLATGRAFRVSQEFIGSYDFGYHTTPERMSLGLAVAASAAVPFVFPPVQLKSADLGLTNAPPTLSLVDGGVYDNIGLEWFQGWGSGRPDAARETNFWIVVDASGRLARLDKRLGWMRGSLRSRSIQYNQSRAARIRWFVDALERKERQGVYLLLKNDAPGGLPKGFGDLLAGVRTDLNRFTEVESLILQYHGYWSAHARFAEYCSDLALVGKPSWREFADLSEADIEVLKRQLSKS